MPYLIFPEPQFYIFLPFFCISAGTRTERAHSMPCALSAAALESPFPVLLKSILSGSMPLLMYLPDSGPVPVSCTPFPPFFPN